MTACIRLTLLSAIALCALNVVNAQGKKPMTFEQIFKGGEPRLTKQLPNIPGWADDRHYLESKRREGDDHAKMYAVNAETGEETPYRDMQQFRDVVGKGIDPASPASASNDYAHLIYTRDNDLFLLDTSTHKFTQLTATPEEEKNPTIAPAGNAVAFTRGPNLYVIDLASGKETAITNDGSDVIYNGWASWVYYEEVLGRPSRYRAFWWSPDSKRLAFFRFNDTRVPVFSVYNATGQHGMWEQAHYPEVGDPNPDVRIGLVDITGGGVVWTDFDEHVDQYFGTPSWTPDGKQLVVQWMNRAQDTLMLYRVDPQSGKKQQAYLETQNSWVRWFDDIRFLKDNKRFILISDKSGWAHLYLNSLDGGPGKPLTSGEWTVAELQLVDETHGQVYFTAKKEASTRTDLYVTSLSGGAVTRLTTGNFTHSVKLSPHGEYFITTYSNVATPTRIALITGKGKVLRTLGDSRASESDDYALSTTEMKTIPTSDGWQLPASITWPVGFDEHKKYPVLISVYGGPGSASVADRWNGLQSQWLAQEGLVQMSVDHRGSGHFGKKGMALMYHVLGKWEMNDYSEAVKWLRRQPWVDSTRICITGGSYGGYVTCLALTAAAEYFPYGIAEYSVTDWRLYDSHYTERYMGTPATNPEGYRSSSVLTHVGNYRGVLRIVHGTMDDNVHMQNSIQLVDTLENLNKHFEFMMYPGGRHGWGGPKAVHLRSDNYRFFYLYLLRKNFPEQLFATLESAGFQRRRN
jgi:dipeptidyl-peptidase 4